MPPRMYPNFVPTYQCGMRIALHSRARSPSPVLAHSWYTMLSLSHTAQHSSTAAKKQIYYMANKIIVNINGFWTTAMQYMLWVSHTAKQKNARQKKSKLYSSCLYLVSMWCLLEKLLKQSCIIIKSHYGIYRIISYNIYFRELAFIIIDVFCSLCVYECVWVLYIAR